MSTWLNKFVNQFKKEALDKLPQEELDGAIPGLNPQEDPSMAEALPPMPPMPLPEEPDVTGNVFEVDLNGVKVKMKLIPELVTKAPAPPMPPSGTGMGTPVDPSSNPNADPEALAAWMEDPNTEKPFGNQEMGTVDPLSQEDDGIAVHDTGSEGDLAGKQPVKVHKKPKTAGIEPTPGADRSNPLMPCAACSNYNPQDDTCAQGIDTMKVQAAKSCSWLNSNFQPFSPDGQQNESGKKDQETYINDVSQLPNSGGESRMAALKNIWKKTS